MPRIVLVALESFNQFGYAVEAGKDIPDDVWQKWEHTDATVLTTRLNNKHLKWEPRPDEPVAVPTKSIDVMEKDELVAHADTVLGVKLDKRQSVETLRQQTKAIADRLLLTTGKKKPAAAPAKPEPVKVDTPPAPPIAPTPPASESGTDGSGSENGGAQPAGENDPPPADDEGAFQPPTGE